MRMTSVFEFNHSYATKAELYIPRWMIGEQACYLYPYYAL